VSLKRKAALVSSVRN